MGQSPGPSHDNVPGEAQGRVQETPGGDEGKDHFRRSPCGLAARGRLDKGRTEASRGMSREARDIHTPPGLGLGQGGDKVRPGFPTRWDPGDAPRRGDSVRDSLPLGLDPPGRRQGIVDTEVLDVDGDLDFATRRKAALASAPEARMTDLVRLTTIPVAYSSPVATINPLTMSPAALRKAPWANNLQSSAYVRSLASGADSTVPSMALRR